MPMPIFASLIEATYHFPSKIAHELLLRLGICFQRWPHVNQIDVMCARCFYVGPLGFKELHTFRELPGALGAAQKPMICTVGPQEPCSGFS